MSLRCRQYSYLFPLSVCRRAVHEWSQRRGEPFGPGRDLFRRQAGVSEQQSVSVLPAFRKKRERRDDDSVGFGGTGGFSIVHAVREPADQMHAAFRRVHGEQPRKMAARATDERLLPVTVKLAHPAEMPFEMPLRDEVRQYRLGHRRGMHIGEEPHAQERIENR